MKYLRGKCACLNLLVMCLLFGTMEVAGNEMKLGWGEMDARVQEVITDRSASDGDLVQAISRLGRISESPEFWTKIANDPSYSISHRRRAIMALFRRHCGNSDMLADLARRLKPIKWLRDSDITDQIDFYSNPFFDGTESNSVFGINVLNGPTIYVKVLGKMSRLEFSRLLRGNQPIPDVDYKTSAGLIDGYVYRGDEYDEWFRTKGFPLKQYTPREQAANMRLLNDRANEARLTKEERMGAVFELFRNHIKPGFTVKEMRAAITNANWLGQSRLATISAGPGLTPVDPGKEKVSNYVLNLFPTIPGEDWCVYFRFSDGTSRSESEALAFFKGEKEVPESIKLVEFVLVADPARIEKFGSEATGK